MFKRTVAITILLLLFFTNVITVRGLEIEVTGNDNSSSNEVSVQHEQTTNSQQTNISDTNNDVDTSVNTGNNQANDNTAGDTNITTGDATNTVAITNTANSSSITDNCCLGGDESESSIIISGNGSGSTNTAQYEHVTNNTIVINNNALISNNVNGSANTGGNTANGNNGNSTIITGAIRASDTIINKNINSVNVTIGDPKESFLIKINGNGSDSVNAANFFLTKNNSIYVNNDAEIKNDSDWFLNTGKNEIYEGNGDAFIKTGGIAFDSLIKNKDINKSEVEITCCKEKEEEKPPTPPTPPPTPPTPPGNGGNGGNGGGGGGGGNGGNGVGGTVLGIQLPATGLSWWLYATLANILMLMMGLYLRMRAGRSPCYVKTN